MNPSRLRLLLAILAFLPGLACLSMPAPAKE